jgi:hypothetical protein
MVSGRRRRATRLSPSEVMTILILFRQSGYRTIKDFRRTCAPSSRIWYLVSYSRFTALIPRVLLTFVVYLHSQMGRGTGIRLIDSTSLSVCTNKQHRPASRLCHGCAARQDLSRLALRVQTPSGGSTTGEMSWPCA